MADYGTAVHEFLAQMFKELAETDGYKLQLQDDVGAVQGPLTPCTVNWSRAANILTLDINPDITFTADSDWGDITDVRLYRSPSAYADWTVFSLATSYGMGENFQLRIEVITITITLAP